MIKAGENENRDTIPPDDSGVASANSETTEGRDEQAENSSEIFEDNVRGEKELVKEKNKEETTGRDKVDNKEKYNGESLDDVMKKLAEAQTEIEKKEKEIAEVKDLLLRRQADFENYKKRIAKSQEDFKKQSIKDFALDVITINDDLLRAIDASSTVKNGESLEQCHNSFVDGVSMISKMIEDMLNKYSIVEIDSLNQSFDPQYNEAVEIVMSSDVREDTITKIYQKGFKLDELVVRSAKVRVARPADPGSENSHGEDNIDNDEGKEAQEIVN